MPIRALRPSPSFTFQPLPNGALLTDTSWQAFQNAQSQLSTRGRTESHSGQWHNGQFRPMIGVFFRGNAQSIASGFLLGQSQCQIDLTLPPGYNRLFLAHKTRLQFLQPHAGSLIGSSIKIDLVQFQGGVILSETDFGEHLIYPNRTKETVQVFSLDSIFRLSANTETRLCIRITYDTCNGVRDYDGQYPSQTFLPAFLTPDWWDGLGWLTYGVYRG